MSKYAYLLLTLLVALVIRTPMHCQTGNTQRIALINLQRSNVVESSRAGQIGLTNTDGNQRYAQYTEVDLTPIGFVPTPTGNTSNYSEFVIAPTGDVYYIDWQGRSILLRNAAVSAGDYDWLEVGNNGIPDNINDSIYTRKYAAVGPRVVWPNATFLVGDSLINTSAVMLGDRNTRWGFYRNTDGTWSSIGQEGTTMEVRLGPTATGFSIATMNGTNPAAPSGGYRQIMQVGKDSTVRLNDYRNTRNDAGVPVNVLTTDALGVVRSHPVGELPGGLPAVPLNEIVVGTGPGITSDPDYKYVPAVNDVQHVGSDANLSVRTTDTTGVITANETNDLSDKYRFAATGNGTGVLVINKDSRASSPSIGDVFLNRSFFDNVSSAGDNQVVNFGINISQGGGVRNKYKSALAWVFENNYKNSPSEKGAPGFGNYEMQFPEVVYTDTIIDELGVKRATGVPINTKRRMIAGYASNERPDYGGNIAFTGDNFSFYDWATSTPRTYLTVKHGQSFPKGLFFLDTAQIVFNRNNVGGIYQADNIGTSKRILHLDKTNRLVLYEQSGSTDTIFTPAGTLVSQNKMEIYPGSGQPLRLGSTATTGAVEIGGQAANALTVKSSLNTTGYQWGVAGYGMWFRDATTGNQILTFDQNVPASALWVRNTSGNLGLGAYPDFDAALHVKRTGVGRTYVMQRYENNTGGTNVYRSDITPQGNISANQAGNIALTAVGMFVAVAAGNSDWGKVLNTRDANGGASGDVYQYNGTDWTPGKVAPGNLFNTSIPQGSNIWHTGSSWSYSIQNRIGWQNITAIGTVTLTPTTPQKLINPGSTQATMTLQLPASPADGQFIVVTFANNITSLTIDGNGQIVGAGAAPTTANEGDTYKWVFFGGSVNKWYLSH